VAQLLVRNLDEGVKEALRRRARCHGRRMEEEARLILSKAAQSSDWRFTADRPGMGSRMAQLFAGLGLEHSIEPLKGEQVQPADFGL